MRVGTAATEVRVATTVTEIPSDDAAASTRRSPASPRWPTRRSRCGRARCTPLIGQNGAGKSTLIKILTGAYAKDAGEVTFDGLPFAVASPQEAQRHGISTIYQEINLVPLRSVAENVFLGREPRPFGLIDWRGCIARPARSSRGSASTSTCGAARQLQHRRSSRWSRSRARLARRRLVIMDEPDLLARRVARSRCCSTSSASSSATASRCSTSRTGSTSSFEICDRVTVMRDGRTGAGAAPIAETTKLELVGLMLGRDIDEVGQAGNRPSAAARPSTAARCCCRPSHLHRSRRHVLRRDVEAAGEIVGLGGLLGSGPHRDGPGHLRRRPADLRKGHAEGRGDRAGHAGRGHRRRARFPDRGPKGRGHRARHVGAREPHAGPPAPTDAKRTDRPREGTRGREKIHRRARHQDRRHGPAHPRAVRRQPAEGPAR